jgi:hypothetical protein
MYYVNAKMILFETIPEMVCVWGGAEERRVMEGANSNMMYLIHCKHFLKGYNVTHPEQQ